MSSGGKTIEGGMSACQSCRRRWGYFRYGICVDSRPLCGLCGRKVLRAPAGVREHPSCLAAMRRREAGENRGNPANPYSGIR